MGKTKIQIENYIGKVYGKLTILGEEEPKQLSSGEYKRVVKCKCVCGNLTTRRLDKVKSGESVSCGCKRNALGHSNRNNMNPSYRSWTAMMSRCVYKSKSDYKLKGITVCERWYNYVNFYEDMGERPKGYTLDRIDPKGNYEPSNCRWATPKEQRNNQITPIQVCFICGHEIKNGYKFNLKQHIQYKHPEYNGPIT